MYRTRRWPRALIAVRAFLLASALSGCALGPEALERTHGKYNEAVRQVDEEQQLRNLVHLRYNETPLDLNVTAIAAQYELAAQAEARPFFLAPNPSGSTFRSFTSILPDVFVTGANRPTISMIPADDSDAVREYLAPIRADTLALMAQSGWPVSTIVRLWIDRMNGIPNAATAGGPFLEATSDFARFRHVVDLLQTAQDHGLAQVAVEDREVAASGALPAQAVTASSVLDAAKAGMEYRPLPDGKSWVLIRKDRRLVVKVNPVGAGTPELAELIALLNLVPGLPQYDIVVASGVPDPVPNHSPPSTELRVLTRSTSQVAFYLARGVDVPEEHVCAGLVKAPSPGDSALTEGLFEVHVCRGHRPPEKAYVAVKYRNYWFYIDDRDQTSKATFMLMLQLSRLDFARSRAASGPVLTLPAGR